MTNNTRKLKNGMPKPTNVKERAFHMVNVLLADAIHNGLSIKGLRIITGIHYLQRRSEEIYVGEIHAIYYEITRDASWSYDSCRKMCNTLYKQGWLDKHMLDGYVAYTLTNKPLYQLGL